MLSDLYMLMDSFFTLMYQFCIATFWLLFSAISWLYLVCLSKKKKKKKNYTNLKSKY